MFQSFHPYHTIQTPFLFFTGKGGVGKTSTACATAVALADAGKKVLIVSTDPASNLQDVFEMELGTKPVPIPSVENLFACNIDPEEAARAYREKVVGPYRGKLPDSVLTTMEEQLSGACTVEIAAFDEFTNLIANEELVSQFDHIIFDTAPTGHTLRLLQLPMAWTGFLEESTHGASCLGPLSGLNEKKQLYAKTMEVLENPEQTTLLLVARPELASLQEANRASKELKEIGIKNQLLIINGLMQQYLENDKVSVAIYQKQQRALITMPKELKQMGIYSLPFVSYSLTGIKHLRYLFKGYTFSANENQDIDLAEVNLHHLTEVVNEFSEKQPKVIFTMGKGGVGKTTIASAIAVGLVEKGHRVHLTTTDPAAHLDFMFPNQNHDVKELLTISKIDPKAEVKAYTQEVLSKALEELEEEELAYLEEDLKSPCTEELAVFRAFAEVVAKSEGEIVIIDTAPTGHTLLLLDAAQSYHKELVRSTGEVPESVAKLLPRLRNPKETSVVIVTLAEATPVLEAQRLQEDLKRANIEPKWWVINQSLYATETIDPVLRGRAHAEKTWIQKVQQDLASHCAIIPWQPEEKIGYDKVKEYTQD
ncbi:MAG: arsenical pump-driving ATPase [Bacillus sp. (in: Bacteria)]|nr:arsenical pump-driving ATPase [Bacillus sp. (in: firmicutes)]